MSMQTQNAEIMYAKIIPYTDAIVAIILQLLHIPQ